MHVLRSSPALTVITDPACGDGRMIVDVVRGALRGGAPAIQLRMKGDAAREMVALGTALRDETRAADAMLFVNDRLDVALAIGADGVHLGDDDLPVAAARSLVPPGFIIGRSADTVEGARAASRDGADYVGVGPMYATRTKTDAGVPVGPGRITEIIEAVDIPAVGIGGVTANNASAVVSAGAAGVAVIGAVMQADDPEMAVRRLMKMIAEASRRRQRT